MHIIATVTIHNDKHVIITAMIIATIAITIADLSLSLFIYIYIYSYIDHTNNTTHHKIP